MQIYDSHDVGMFDNPGEKETNISQFEPFFLIVQCRSFGEVDSVWDSPAVGFISKAFYVLLLQPLSCVPFSSGPPSRCSYQLDRLLGDAAGFMDWISAEADGECLTNRWWIFTWETEKSMYFSTREPYLVGNFWRIGTYSWSHISRRLEKMSTTRATCWSRGGKK